MVTQHFLHEFCLKWASPQLNRIPSHFWPKCQNILPQIMIQDRVTTLPNCQLHYLVGYVLTFANMIKCPASQALCLHEQANGRAGHIIPNNIFYIGSYDFGLGCDCDLE